MPQSFPYEGNQYFNQWVVIIVRGRTEGHVWICALDKVRLRIRLEHKIARVASSRGL
jgi:hypothetical protein